MSHFAVTVALPGNVVNLKESLELALAPFDENLTMARYVAYTKADLIARGREEVERFKNSTYATYLADVVAYCASHSSPAHLSYLAGTSRDGGFPALLDRTDEQVYADEVQWYEPEDVGADGEVYSTSNAEAKWDWWVIGGRWGGMWTLKDGAHSGLITEESSFVGQVKREHATDCARLGDIAAETLVPTHAFIDLKGEWHEGAHMGWFGLTSHDKPLDVWIEEYQRFITGLDKDVWAVNVDAHI